MSVTIRSLLRTPGFTATVVLVLALGIGANSAIFSIVNAVLLRPLPYREPDRLCRLAEVNPKGDTQGVPRADMQAFDRLFAESIAARWFNYTITGPEGAENVMSGRMAAQGFNKLGAQAALGRVFRPEEYAAGGAPVAVLSDRLWSRRYGRDPSVLGRPIVLNGTTHTIVGVLPPEFFFDRRYEIWTPWVFTADELSRRDARLGSTVVRLKPGASREQAEAEALAVFRSIAPEDAQKGWKVRLTSVTEEMTGRVRPAMLISLGAVGFVLLIACINVANLLLARASDRSHEIAIRLALGASRWTMIRQFLAESLTLAVAGGALGLAVGWASAKALVATFPERIPLPRVEQTRMDGVVLLFTIGVALLTGVLFGLLPALQASRVTAVNERLKEGGRGSSGSSHGRRVRSVLIVVETALSLVLLTGAGLMLRSFDRLLKVDPGFQAERVLAVRVPMPTNLTQRPQQAAYYTRLLDRMQSMPGVNSAGLIMPLPLAEIDANGTIFIPGRGWTEPQLVKMRVANAGYFRSMGIALKQGRVFDDRDQDGATQAVVINESFARKFYPGENPVGQMISGSRDPKQPGIQIIGVVADVKARQLSDSAEPEMYRDYRQFIFGGFGLTLTLRTAGDPQSVAAAAQKEVRSLNPDQPIGDVRTMEKVIRDNVSQPRFYTLLLTIFASLALVLAAIGLYGVLSFSVSRRAHEIGMRMALGAQRGSIFGLVLKEALQLVGMGVALGLGGAAALTRLMKAQLFETTPLDAATFVAVAVVMFAVAVVAACVPARRAVALNPVDTIWGR